MRYGSSKRKCIFAFSADGNSGEEDGSTPEPPVVDSTLAPTSECSFSICLNRVYAPGCLEFLKTFSSVSFCGLTVCVWLPHSFVFLNCVILYFYCLLKTQKTSLWKTETFSVSKMAHLGTFSAFTLATKLKFSTRMVHWRHEWFQTHPLFAQNSNFTKQEQNILNFVTTEVHLTIQYFI